MKVAGDMGSICLFLTSVKPAEMSAVKSLQLSTSRQIVLCFYHCEVLYTTAVLRQELNRLTVCSTDLKHTIHCC